MGYPSLKDPNHRWLLAETLDLFERLQDKQKSSRYATKIDYQGQKVGVGVPRSTFVDRLTLANELLAEGIDPRVDKTEGKPRYRVPAGSRKEVAVTPEAIVKAIKRQSQTVDDLAARFDLGSGEIADMLLTMKSDGWNIHELGGRWTAGADLQAAFISGPVFEFVSQSDNTFKFGVSGDQHIGSKYFRQDVLDDLYDRFEAAGVDRVFNTGNWIDGEARFNKFDLTHHGLDGQIGALVDLYPQRDGITTYAVAGDDHEGWYAQKEGIDIGRWAELKMRAAGRHDWVNMGYMEAHVKLVNANTGMYSIMSVVHPGGGSSYALSYSIQKIIESLDGGEKPAVGLYGHYHKLWSGNIRNVWCLQSGTTQDQTPFMRKKKIEAHVGGALVEMEQDPSTGAIIEFTPRLRRYFNRGYYGGRWSHGGPVNLPERGIAA